VNEDSSFRLTVPEKAVDKPPVNIALECGAPLIPVCIEGISKSNFRHRFKCLDITAWYFEQ